MNPVAGPRIAGLTALLLAAPAAFAADDGMPSPGVDVSSLLRLTVGLAVVVGAIFLVSWILRRVGGVRGGANGQMRVLGGVAVGNRERVVLVQVGETQLLVGVAPGRVQTLHVLDKPIEVPTGGAKGAGQAGPFAERLRQLMGQDEK
ncbi:MAG TPA: flagellar biosynthetic protein FliO [Gammaproteobacteria bacterium]|nr:flagellar biosynthetic protein FliO [Gammaproteobacteria bacterium]